MCTNKSTLHGVKHERKEVGLKCDSEKAHLICSGNALHSFGAATANAHSALNLSLALGTVRSGWSANLRDWLGK